jgi:hypothetical protein
MPVLSLIWILLGVALGALANGACWGLQARCCATWRETLGTLAIGAAVLVPWRLAVARKQPI